MPWLISALTVSGNGVEIKLSEVLQNDNYSYVLQGLFMLAQAVHQSKPKEFHFVTVVLTDEGSSFLVFLITCMLCCWCWFWFKINWGRIMTWAGSGKHSFTLHKPWFCIIEIWTWFWPRTAAQEAPKHVEIPFQSLWRWPAQCKPVKLCTDGQATIRDLSGVLLVRPREAGAAYRAVEDKAVHYLYTERNSVRCSI